MYAVYKGLRGYGQDISSYKIVFVNLRNWFFLNLILFNMIL